MTVEEWHMKGHEGTSVDVPVPYSLRLCGSRVVSQKAGTVAKVKLSPFIQEISGTLNGLVFKRSPQGEIIVSKKPDMSKVVWSEAQQAQRERFTRAQAYATAAKADPKVWAKYQRRAKRLNMRPRDLAISDHLQGKNLLLKKSLESRKSTPSGK